MKDYKMGDILELECINADSQYVMFLKYLPEGFYRYWQRYEYKLYAFSSGRIIYRTQQRFHQWKKIEPCELWGISKNEKL